MATENWSIDPVHSTLEFNVTHLLISEVTGSFKTYTANISAGQDFADTTIHAEVDTNSISTNNEMRDNHLKSAELFDVESFPKLKFESESFTKVNDKEFKLIGNLTIKDITKSIPF